MDSATTLKNLLSTVDQQNLSVDEKKKPKKKKKKEETELKLKTKSTKLQKYVYLLDKPLEKILVRYRKSIYNFPIKNNMSVLIYLFNLFLGMNGYLLNSQQSYFPMAHNPIQVYQYQIRKKQIRNQRVDNNAMLVEIHQLKLN